MEWTESLKRAVGYMESHLMEHIGAEEVAQHLHMSPFYFQKGFKIMTGYSVAEYIRCRRLYLAALDALSERAKVIELAYKYGYDTPESFTKAFSRFHGTSPNQLKGSASRIRTFLPLKITVEIKGGYDMDYVVEKMDAFSVIGLERMFDYESSYREIPMFWGEFHKDICGVAGTPEEKERLREFVGTHVIGEFAVCCEAEKGSREFPYLIAGHYQGGAIPNGFTVREIPAAEWARFRCVGPMPGAIQAVITRIFREWLPGNPDYEIALGINIEWYSGPNTDDADYLSEIWIPVKRK